MKGEHDDSEMLNAAVDQLGASVLITEKDLQPPGPRIIYVNRQLLDMSGYRREELIGRTPRIFQGPETDRATLDQIRRTLARGREFEGEVLNYAKDGSTHWVHLHISPVRDDAGEIVRWVCVRREVTDHRIWADEMQRINAVLSVQMELSPDGILVVDDEGRVIAYNGRFQKMWGIPLESFASAQWADLLQHVLAKVEDPDGFRAKVEEFQHSKQKQFQDEVKLKDGRIFERYFVATRSPQGQFYGWLWYFSDVTQQREFEHRLGEARREAEAASLAKSRFLANMSHEIRTPLNGILGMTEILLQTDVTNEQRDFLSTIQTSGDNLLILINDLLDLSKIESGRLELDSEPFDLLSLIEDAIAVVGGRIGRKKLDLGYLIDPRLPERFRSDENRIRQVLINLLGNSIKFTERGEVVIEVNLLGSDSLPDSVADPDRIPLHFTVRDTGIGISEENQKKLFKPFSQVDPSTTRRYGGSGLGLSICRRLVELLDGEIWVESRPGKGSAFHFTLPLKAERGSTSRRAVHLDLSGRTLLVVDDNEVNRSMVRHQASRQGMRVDEAPGGREALAKLKSGTRYDVIVVDMQMPEMDGLMFSREVRRRFHVESPPMILSTSLGNYAELKREVEDEGLYYLSKPFRQFQLSSLLGEIFEVEGARHEEVTDGSAWQQTGFDRNLRILLAEDNEVNLKVAVGLLRRLGIQPDHSVTGKQAVERWEKDRQDVVFMDVHMPEMDGLEATRRIRRISDDPIVPWIVGMTADALPRDRERALEAGMNDYLSKPVKSIDLASALRRAPHGAESVQDKPSGDPGFSEKLLSQLAELGDSGDDGFVRELVEMFLADVPRQIGGMRKGIENGDARAVSGAAHSVKGMSANFGAVRLQEKCEALERRGRDGRLDGADRLIGEIEAAFREVENVLNQRYPSL